MNNTAYQELSALYETPILKKFKIVFAIVIALTIIACKRNQKDIDWKTELSQLGPMGEAYMRMARKDCIGKCQWTRLSKNTLKFEGTITHESYDEFMQKIDDDISDVVVNSAGGSVTSGLKIAAEIQRRNLNVVVKGYCVSSCANYLFLSGNRKEIDGVLGFHGNARALTKDICKKNDDDPQCRNGIKEKAFFESIGMSNLLFDVTQSLDKGMQTGMAYVYYAPSANTLKELGVKGIVGDQNKDYLKQMKNYYDEFELPEFSVATDPNPTILKRLKETQISSAK